MKSKPDPGPESVAHYKVLGKLPTDREKQKVPLTADLMNPSRK